MLDHVHRRHRQPRPVHHAPDVPVEADVGEVELGRLRLRRVLLVEVPQLLDVLVAEQAVAVEVHLCVEGDDVAVLGQHQGVDLRERAVGVDERIVEGDHELDRLPRELPGDPEAEGELARLKGHESHGRVDPLLQDLLGRLRRDRLDLHPAFGGGHHHDPGNPPVDDHSKVEFPLDPAGLLDQDPLHLLPLGARLVGHQGHPEDLLRVLPRLFGGFRELHAAALAAPPGVDLGLHDDGCAELLGDGLRLRRCIRDLPLRDGHAVLRQNGLGLVLVYVHILRLLPVGL